MDFDRNRGVDRLGIFDSTIIILGQIDVSGRDNLNALLASIKELRRMSDNVDVDTLSQVIDVLETTNVRGEHNMLYLFTAINNLSSIMEEFKNDSNDQQGKNASD